MNEEWPEDREKRLAELAAEGLSARVIAADLGVTRNAVIGKCRRIGVSLGYVRTPAEPRLPRAPRPPREPRAPRGPRNVHSRIDREIVRAMYLAGETYTAIYNETGYSSASILYHTKDLPRRRHDNTAKRYPQQMKVDAVVALLTGERICALSTRLGIPRKAIEYWRKRPGVRSIAQPLADSINAAREAEERTAAALKAQAEARERMWIDANNAEVFPQMPPRDAVMMRMRAAGDTLEAVGQVFKVTRERVRQIEVRWRTRGLIVPSAKPLSDAAKAAYGKPPGKRGPKPKRQPIAAPDFYSLAHATLDGKRAPMRLSEEERERRRAWGREIGARRKAAFA